MASKTKVSPQRDIKKEIIGEFKCSCCSTVFKKQQGSYIASNSLLYRGNNGYTHCCRNCADSHFRTLVGNYNGDEQKALKHMCSLLDIYFSQTAFSVASNMSVDSGTLFNRYLSRLNMAQHKATGKTYLDYINESKDCPVEIESGGDEIETYVAPPEVVLAWGKDYTNEEYLYLSTEFEDYKARYDIATKAHEELVRTICVAQLSIRKTQDVGERTKMMKTLQDLIRTADLKPNRAADEAALSAENSFGMLIKKLENERPIKKPNPEWEDIDNINSYINNYFLSHICKLTKRPIPNEEEYNEEMAKYTVKPPTYDDINE